MERTFTSARAVAEDETIDCVDPYRDLVFEISELHHSGERQLPVFDARQAAGLTQTKLAEAVGTTQSVISQLEDADYEGHSLSMLRRIAKALHRRVEIRMVPDDTERMTG